jgi:hypothetical protein
MRVARSGAVCQWVNEWTVPLNLTDVILTDVILTDVILSDVMDEWRSSEMCCEPSGVLLLLSEWACLWSYILVE